MKCPYCHGEKIWSYKSRPISKCSECLQQFGNMSQTIFAYNKMAVAKYKKGIVLLCRSDAVSINQFSREMGVEWRTANAVCQKVRAAMVGGNDHWCGHAVLGKAPRGKRIAACSICRQVVIADRGQWADTPIQVSDLDEDNELAENCLKYILGVQAGD